MNQGNINSDIFLGKNKTRVEIFSQGPPWMRSGCLGWDLLAHDGQLMAIGACWAKGRPPRKTVTGKNKKEGKAIIKSERSIFPGLCLLEQGKNSQTAAGNLKADFKKAMRRDWLGARLTWFWVQDLPGGDLRNLFFFFSPLLQRETMFVK